MKFCRTQPCRLRHPMNRNDETGFTLIELMVIVAISGIISVLAITQFQSMISRTKAKSATRQLRADLQKAKLEAIKRNTDCLVDFTVAVPGNSGTCITCISTDNDCDDAGDTIISRLDFNDYSNVELQNANFTGATVFVFNSRGMPGLASVSMQHHLCCLRRHSRRHLRQLSCLAFLLS